MKLSTISNEPKWKMFATSGLGLLQMILALVTRWCGSEDPRSSSGVDCELVLGGVAARILGPQVGWIVSYQISGVDCELPN